MKLVSENSLKVLNVLFGKIYKFENIAALSGVKYSKSYIYYTVNKILNLFYTQTLFISEK
jgi:hypothetical protein